MSYYRYEQERGELPEPIVYGGYGSGANAVQKEYGEPAGDDAGEFAEHAGTGCVGTSVIVDGLGRFRSVAAAARAIGVSRNALIGKLKRGRGAAVVDGYKVRKADR